jgi:hypothetical protein
MRAYVIGFISACSLAFVCQTARAIPSVPTSVAVEPLAKIVPAAHHCGKGQRWVPAGYAKHGKYRTGHCAPT